jgi:hypothetical protein
VESHEGARERAGIAAQLATDPRVWAVTGTALAAALLAVGLVRRRA